MVMCAVEFDKLCLKVGTHPGTETFARPLLRHTRIQSSHVNIYRVSWYERRCSHAILPH